jgi:hypothetical protein
VNAPPEVRIPERHRKPGVCYAVTDEGIELPVIDVTHPAFACDVSPAVLSALIDESVRDIARVRNTPPDVLRGILAQSILARGWVQSVGSFMSGMTTYLNRLGPENLGDGYASPIDRKMAAGLLALSFRLRLRDLARAGADAVASALAVPDGRPVLLLNIGGGAAADTLNSLILVNKEHPERLRGRRVSIVVLDLDDEGPSFGGRALAALLAKGAPLAGLPVTYRHVRYDWSDVARLRETLAAIGDIGAGVCSSEGALFDYGSDEDIVANLTALRDATPPGFAVVGSVVRDASTIDPRMIPTTEPGGRPLIRYLGLEAFCVLAERAGWRVERTIDSVAHHAVELKKTVIDTRAASDSLDRKRDLPRR